MPLAGIIISIVVAVLFLSTGLPKVLGQAKVLDQGAHLGFAAPAYRRLGIVELLGAAGLLAGLAWSPIGIAAAVGFVVMMVGAVVVHLRAKDPVPMVVPAVVVGIAAAAIVPFQLV